MVKAIVVQVRLSVCAQSADWPVSLQDQQSRAQSLQVPVMSDPVAILNYLYMLQITEKLLEAEEKKLHVLKAEIEAGRRTDANRDTSKVVKSAS